MAATIKAGSVLRREIRVYGVEGPVILEVSNEGIRLWVKGSRTSIMAGWREIVDRAMSTPTNVKSYLMGRPLDLLIAEAKKYKARK